MKRQHRTLGEVIPHPTPTLRKLQWQTTLQRQELQDTRLKTAWKRASIVRKVNHAVHHMTTNIPRGRKVQQRILSGLLGFGLIWAKYEDEVVVADTKI